MQTFKLFTSAQTKLLGVVLTSFIHEVIYILCLKQNRHIIVISKLPNGLQGLDCSLLGGH